MVKKIKRAKARKVKERNRPMRDFHIVLTNGTERNVRAKEFTVDNGALVLSNSKTDPVVVYAEGAWSMIETEQRDTESLANREEASGESVS